ncbi:MAG TPA: MFS transporter [Gemmatimonadaceae bacterium]|nr:MFS transporter [Gemmatimonadaceae bacterium]
MPNPDTHIHQGTPEFRAITLGMFAAGFATFALLYCVQPLMPVFAREFGVSAAESSLPLSLTTGFLAPAMIIAGAFSESRGRTQMMVGSLLASALLMLLSAFSPRWSVLLVLRTLAGITFAGLPAVSMAYLSEEIHPTSIGLAMGLSIGGNGLGGMIGRLLTALIADLLSWRYALGAIGLMGVSAAIIAWKTLPPSRHFAARRLEATTLYRLFWMQLRNPRLVGLYALGFLLMGAFVTTYNYITYHLLAAPYRLSHTIVGFIFVVYLVGIFASAWIGSLADRVGRARVLLAMVGIMLLGIGLTVLRPLLFVVLGIAVITFGFFGGHSVASSWVGLRAHQAKAQAAALYLFFYYLGSSVAGSAGGVFWDAAGWRGVAGFVAALLVVAVSIALITTRAEQSPVRAS